jgi:hypothetical protein
MSKRVLVVANRTAASEPLQEVVRRMAGEGAQAFHLVVPSTPSGLSRLANPDETGLDQARQQLEEAMEKLERAAGMPVTGAVGAPDPLAAVEDAVNAGDYDHIVISTLPRRLSRWLHLDLPHKAAGLGLPVKHVQADGTPVEIEPAGRSAMA